MRYAWLLLAVMLAFTVPANAFFLRAGGTQVSGGAGVVWVDNADLYSTSGNPAGTIPTTSSGDTLTFAVNGNPMSRPTGVTLLPNGGTCQEASGTYGTSTANGGTAGDIWICIGVPAGDTSASVAAAGSYVHALENRWRNVLAFEGGGNSFLNTTSNPGTCTTATTVNNNEMIYSANRTGGASPTLQSPFTTTLTQFGSGDGYLNGQPAGTTTATWNQGSGAYTACSIFALSPTTVPQTITSVGLSGNIFGAGQTSGTVIGTASTVMNQSPPFSGSYSIVSSGTDHSSTACTSTNSTNFQINASTGVLALNTTLGAGTYPGVCIAATQTSPPVTNSPYIQAFTITGNPQAFNYVQLSGTSYTPNTANAVVGTVSVLMSPTTPASTAALTIGGANTGGFQLVGSGCSNISTGTCTLEANSAGTTGVGPYSDVNIIATQSSISNSPLTYAPTLTGSGPYVFAANTITMSNQSGAAVNGSYTVMPSQFGRVFIDSVYNPSGSIAPASQCPEVTAYLSAGTGTLNGAVTNSTSGTLAASFTSGTYIVTDGDTTDGGLRELTLNTTTAVVSGTSLTFSSAQTLKAGDVLNFYPTSGTVISSQMDAKNFYPDGNVEFAVMSMLVPTSFLPTSGADSLYSITPASGACTGSGLTSAQMLNSSNFPFDAQITIGSPAQLLGGNVPSYNYANSFPAAYQTVTNGGFDITINGTPYTITGLNFATPSHAQLATQTNAGSAALTLSAIPNFITNGNGTTAVITDISNSAAITPGTTVVCGAAFNPTVNCTMSAVAAQNILTSDTLGFSIVDFAYQAGLAGPQIQQIVQAGVDAVTGAGVVHVSIPDGCCTALIQASITTTAIGSGASITVASPPASGTDMSLMFGLNSAAVTGYGGKVSSPIAHTASARTMLTAANAGPGCTNGPITSLCNLGAWGPVATEIHLADVTGGYDFGIGDGHTPLQPQFDATFWPSTGQVWVRPIGQNAQTTYSEDMAFYMYMCTGYPSCIQGTQGYPSSGYYDMTGDNSIEDWAWSVFDKQFWIGAAPTPEINVDNNINYWDQTHVIAHYDPTLVMNEADLGTYYTSYYTNISQNIFTNDQNGGYWPESMENYGGHGYIGLNPSFDLFWLYSPNWKLRQLSEANTDQAGLYPLQAQESRAGYRLSRADTAGTSTGLGYPASITDNSCNIAPSAGGPANCFPTGSNVSPNGVNLTHMPAAYNLPYLLTGDPFYLRQKLLWSGVNAMTLNTRGPTSEYEYIMDRGNDGGGARGLAWPARDLFYAAFDAPDGSPTKSYFTYLVNDHLAAEEAGLAISDSTYSGGSTGNQNSYNYGLTRRDAASCLLNSGGSVSTDCGGTPVTIPFGFWSGAGQEWGSGDQSAPSAGGSCCGQALYTTNSGVYGFGDPWMHWYLSAAYGIGAQLGFHALPLLETQNAIIQDINGHTTTNAKVLVSYYEWPTNQSNGGWVQPSAAAAIANNLPWKIYDDVVGSLTGYLEDTSTPATTGTLLTNATGTLSTAITSSTTGTLTSNSTVSGTFGVTDSFNQLVGSPTATIATGSPTITFSSAQTLSINDVFTISIGMVATTTGNLSANATIGGTFNVSDSLSQLTGSPTATITAGNPIITFSSTQTLSNGDVFTLYKSQLHITSIPSGDPVNWLDLIDCSGCTEETIEDFGGGGGVGAYQVNIPQVNGSSGSPVAMTATPNYFLMSSQAGIPQWIAQLYPGGYDAYANAGLAMLVDNSVAGASSAWSWLYTNEYVPIQTQTTPYDSFTTCVYTTCTYDDGYWGPLWAIVPFPSNDPVHLPAQPTATPQ